MKKAFIALALVLSVAMVATAQAKPGPIVDKLIFDVRMDQTIALKDTAEGKTDVFFFGVDAKIFRGLSAEDKAKLQVYAVPSGSWSLMLNPIPNKAPYQWTTKDGKTFFNPLAIREVRYALNWLIDRKKIVDEILLGDGDPMITPMTPGQPGTYKYNLLPAKFGMTARGNEKKAIADIDAAMRAAALLPENAGKLAKVGQWWTFNGEPIVIKMAIRVDDPTGRLLEGRYIADQIEKAGIKCDRMELDRSKCVNLAYNGDPADYGFHIYTEGWGAGATRAYWAISTSQMYAPYYGYQAGGSVEGFWNYLNPELDQLAQDTLNGQVLTEAEYWEKELRAVEIGIKEATRIYVCSQMQYYVANKARLLTRMAYGLGDGMNHWSIRTADVKAGADGLKTLKVTQFSARGSLFMSAWDPIGTDGFTDVYSRAILEPIWDPVTFQAPNSAKDTPLRVTWVKYDAKFVKGADGKLSGQLPIPAGTVTYDKATKTWVAVAAGAKAGSYAISKYMFGKWHNGREITQADIIDTIAFGWDWLSEDGKGDKFYDAGLAAQSGPTYDTYRGFAFNKDGTVTMYSDYNFPMDMINVAATNTPTMGIMPWDVREALGLLVAEGSASGTTYSFSADPALVEVDLIQPKAVADLKAKIVDMKAKKFIPAYLKGYVTEAQAVAAYDATIKFIDKYGHAMISNGPFFISKIDFTANYVECLAWRDAYPWKSDYWPKAFQTQLTRIDQIKVPATAQRTKDVVIDISLSAVTYPADTSKPLGKDGKVQLTLVLPSGEKVYQAKYLKDGTFQVIIPKTDLSSVKPGSYTIVVESKFDKESPSVIPETLVLF